MKYLTADFGSTYTKLTAIDSQKEEILGTASAFTTIGTNVKDGFNVAFHKLEKQIGRFHYDKLLCCSSAAGGLKMVALGLVPELTAKAAKMAASSAGAKVMKTYSFEISKAEQEEIQAIQPDLVLLCGGTNGGNKDVIIANAKRLCAIAHNFSVICAGNKSASHELDEIFAASGKNYVITENVMPEFNQLNIEPAKQKIRELFISRIVDAKGLHAVSEMSDNEIIPTPLAVLNACELLSKGTKTTEGWGDLMTVDIGGATTDVYSMAYGLPTIENSMTKGFPEPFAKRTVEGDLGMRYSLTSLVEEMDVDAFADELSVDKEVITNWVASCVANPDSLATVNSVEQKIEEGIARNAIKIAFERHCGIFESVYTPFGQMFTLTGKDLTNVKFLIGTGGIIITSRHPQTMLEGAKAEKNVFNFAKPRNPEFYIDKKYILASMGLLSSVEPEAALRIMKKEITLA